jgi:hypothetical protein
LRVIEIGQALEEMLETDGWKYIETWVQQQENKAASDLKTKEFTDLSEVKALQVKLKTYKELRGEINHRIQKGREARQKQE